MLAFQKKHTEDGHLVMTLHVAQYKPEEINVRLCDNNLVVEAKTEGSTDDSYYHLGYRRWVRLPEDAVIDGIKSTLTRDKKLLIDVPIEKCKKTKDSFGISVHVEREPPEEDEYEDELEDGQKEEACNQMDGYNK